jgi:hypothetical protein
MARKTLTHDAFMAMMDKVLAEVDEQINQMKGILAKQDAALMSTFAWISDLISVSFPAMREFVDLYKGNDEMRRFIMQTFKDNSLIELIIYFIQQSGMPEPPQKPEALLDFLIPTYIGSIIFWVETHGTSWYDAHRSQAQDIPSVQVLHEHGKLLAGAEGFVRIPNFITALKEGVNDSIFDMRQVFDMILFYAIDDGDSPQKSAQDFASFLRMYEYWRRGVITWEMITKQDWRQLIWDNTAQGAAHMDPNFPTIQVLIGVGQGKLHFTD